MRISRELDRPGKLGFLTFILPLILDSIFHKMAPKVFQPNTIAMLQLEGWSFRQVARRKRFDRIGQVAIITTVLSAMVATAKLSLSTVARLIGRKTSTVTAGVATIAVAAALSKKLAAYLVPGMAPADVLNKTKSKVAESNNESFLTGRGK